MFIKHISKLDQTNLRMFYLYQVKPYLETQLNVLKKMK